MIDKNIFGFEVKIKEDLNLILPDKSSIKLLRSQIQFRNKEFFWNAIKPIVNSLSDFGSVTWKGVADMRNEAERVTRNLKERKASALKDVMVDFYCYFYGEDSNITLMANFLMTKKGFDISKYIVEKGALCLVELPEMMSWIKYKASRWGDNMDNNTYERWQESKDTAPVAMMSYILNGAAPNMVTNSYFTPNYPYIIPDYLLIKYVLQKENPSIAVTDISNPRDQGLTLFSGEDLFGNENSLQTLIVSGSIPVGKSKIGINTVKKLNTFLSLVQFPEGMNRVMSRSEYIANAAFLIFGEPSDMEFPEKMLPDKIFLYGMYSNIQVGSRYYLMTILANSVKNLSQEFYYLKKTALNNLFKSVTDILIEGHKHMDKGWISYESFCRRANYLLSLCGQGYIYPDKFTLKPEAVKNVEGNLMAPSEFKKNIHDVILRAMIEGMAAIGGVELLVDKDGNIAYLRLSEAGRWYVGITDEVPKSKVIANVADSIEVDDPTGLISIKNLDYPYVNMLSEFADKMTDTRYCFSEKAFFKKCDSPDELDAKIKRFKMFILPEPGVSITHRIENMKANCDLVKKTIGGSTFQLFDIDPKNSRLHNLILDNKEIRKNSLRVEGCKLLVKSKFLSRFFDILSENGFLNSITI